MQLCNSLHRIIPVVDLEIRVAALEKELAQRDNKFGLEHDSMATEIAAAGSDPKHSNAKAAPPADACSSEASNPLDDKKKE